VLDYVTTVLEECSEEKDLGVLISRDGKVERQCAEAVKKGFKVLGMITRTFVTRKREVILQLYKSLVRPLLDNCVQAWRPYRKKDIDLIERVQKRATRMVEECKGLEYEVRLMRLGLTMLETRRLRADLIEVYKILIGEKGVRSEDFFIGMNRQGGLVRGDGGMRLRGNKWKIHKKIFRTDYAKYSFGNRVIKWWNKIPDSVIEGEGGMGGYKGRLDKLMRREWGLV
jgi:ribonuclease P/MRP protein subunit RPP40